MATGAALAVIILVLTPVSGAHLNPAVTLVERACGRRSSREAALYVGAQLAGAMCGAVLANLMFDLPAVELSTTARAGAGVLLGEVVATAGLVVVILSLAPPLAPPGRSRALPFAVGAYIGAACLFTSSTAFANPAVTVGRMLTDTFAGIAPASVVPFVVAQLVGAGLGFGIALALHGRDVPVGGTEPRKDHP